MNRAAYFFLVLTVVLGSGFLGYRFSSPGVESGRQVEDKSDLATLQALRLNDINGRAQPLAQWQGQILVVNFWATWCPPCRREIPGFIKLSRKFSGNGVQFVGIGTDDSDKVRQYAQDAHIPYPILLGDESLLRLTQGLGNPTEALPFTVIMDRKGRIAFIREGFLDEDPLLRVLQSLLQGN